MLTSHREGRSCRSGDLLVSSGLNLLGLISWPSVLVSSLACWVGKPCGKPKCSWMGSCCPVPSEQSSGLKLRCGGFWQFLLPLRLDLLLLVGGSLAISSNRAVFILNDQKVPQKRFFPLFKKKSQFCNSGLRSFVSAKSGQKR